MARHLLAAGLLATAAAAVHGQSADSIAAAWGTAPGYTTLMAHDFSQAGVYSEGFGDDAVQQYLGASWCAVGFGSPEIPIRAQAQVDAPDGATLSQMQVWAYDVDPDDGLTAELWQTCQPPGLSSPSSSLLGSIDSVGAPGTFFAFTPLDDHRVDNTNCAYTVRVTFNPGVACKGGVIQLQKVQVSWKRSVGPAPAVATFGDVPKTHPFFQYVEALAGSGVTGGCGNGSYCPDMPLTRGQMAVFLSKALGLEWP
jgi:hypothetical protein